MYMYIATYISIYTGMFYYVCIHVLYICVCVHIYIYAIYIGAEFGPWSCLDVAGGGTGPG